MRIGQEGGVIPAIRAFIAIELPDGLLKKIAELQKIIKKDVKGSRTVSWPRAHGIHLTLKFLGDVEESRVEEIYGALKKATAGFGPMRLKAGGGKEGGGVGGVGGFPNLKNPRVLWVGLDGPEEFLKLQRSVEEAMQRLGFEKEERPFKPHLTLCRIKSPEDARILGHNIEKLKDFIDMDFEAGHLVLFKSVLSPKGALYTALKRIDLE